jgi:hypothetical protein
LRGEIDRVERLARGHEQPVALWAAEADVAADLRQTDAADQLALRRPGNKRLFFGAAMTRAEFVGNMPRARSVGWPEIRSSA